MTGGTRAQQEMIDAITSAGEDWPLTLLYLTPNGANIKLKDQVGEVHRGDPFDDE